MRQCFGWLSGIFWIFFLLVFGVDSIFAVDSCTVSTTPSSVEANTNSAIQFSLTNTGVDPITYIKVLRPSTNFTLENRGVDGWTVYANSSQAEIVGSSLTFGSTLNFSFNVVAAGVEVASADWLVYSNTGSGLVECTGSKGLAISGIADVIAPVISDEITVSDVADTSVKINWTTDEAATSKVFYDATGESFDLEKEDLTLSTTHGVTLDGLTANTTYYFYVESADANGNTSNSSEGSFVTAAAGATTTTVTVTNTVTSTVTQTVTKVLTDTTPPVVKLKELDVDQELGVGVFDSAPLIEGSASDDRGVAKIEYRITNYESNWIEGSLLGTVGDKKTNFEFLPSISLDGTYDFEVRAVDVFGNKSAVKKVKFVIDKLPPTVGGVVVTVSGVVMDSEGGVVTILEKNKTRLVFKELGGAEKISVYFGEKLFEAQKDKSTSVWSLEFELDAGMHKGRVVAVDGAGKVVDKNWFDIDVLPRGNLKFDEVRSQKHELNLWWQGNDGVYKKWSTGSDFGFVVPPGKYYISGVSEGKRFVSQVFDFDRPSVISGEWDLQNLPWWSKLFPVGRLVTRSKVHQKVTDLVIDQSLIPAKWYGTKKIVYVFTPDLPYSIEGYMIAKKEAEESGSSLVVLGLQSSEEEMKIWIADKKVDFESDWEGKWLRDGRIKVLPTKLYLDTFGKVVNIKEGVY